MNEEQGNRPKLSDSLEEAARHSEILAYPMPENGDIEKVMKVQEARIFHEIGFKAGAKWQKEQIMKDAEETELYWDGDFLAIDLNMAALGYSERDKVRIIIVKEDNQ